VELVPSFATLVHSLAQVMTVPTFNNFLMLLTGWVFARRRTITSMILAADLTTKHHSAFHRVFASARWNLDALGLAVFDLICPWLGDGVIFLALDDTLARKRGKKMFGVGMHHDPLNSTRACTIVSQGHDWVVLGVLVTLPFCAKRRFCLPILMRLYLNQSSAETHGRRHRTRPELANELLAVFCNHCKNRNVHVVADSAYGGQSVVNELPDNCDLTSRLLLNARLYDPPPAEVVTRRGRPRQRGERRPTPQEMLNGADVQRLELDIYGRRDHVEVAQTTARRYATPDRPVRVVAVRPLTGGRHEQAFFSTRHDATAQEVLTWYASRWAIEVTFRDVKQYLGFEEPQGWTESAVERTAPMAMLLYTLILLWFAQTGHRAYQPPDRPWYRSKSNASFADMLTTLRSETIRHGFSSTLDTQGTHQKILEPLLRAYLVAA
jgi:SRSO17 transposase